MLAKLSAFALVGIDAVPVEIEVDAAAGLPKTILVGLPELAVKESVHRIERALANLGYARPRRPHYRQPGPGRSAERRRRSSTCRSPWACSSPRGSSCPNRLKNCAIVGELALDGNLRPIKGACRWAWRRASWG